jgi:uncharacterized protein (DUF1499 family)
MGGVEAHLRGSLSMARRPFTGEPVSRLAVWSGRLAWFSLAMAALSVVILRSGLLEIAPALVTFAAALILAALAIVLSLASSVVIWRQGLSGIGRAVTGLFIGAALLAYPGYLGTRAYRLPAITDITTDPANPPRFEVIGRLRPRGTSAYPGAATAALQRAAYPDIVPLQVLTPPKTTYDVALAAVTRRKWIVVDARPPAANRREGIIEAVARTPIMGFRDDVVIRINPVGTGSQIDVRSASRYGFHDFGTNAARVRSLLEDIDEAAALQAPDQKPEPKAEPEKKSQPKRPPAKR